MYIYIYTFTPIHVQAVYMCRAKTTWMTGARRLQAAVRYSYRILPSSSDE